MTKFNCLPVVLQDLIVDFAFKLKKDELERDIDLLLTIKMWDLHPRYLRQTVFLSIYQRFKKTPLRVYFALEKLDHIDSLFNFFVVEELLERLDWRRKPVRRMGSRKTWLKNLENFHFVPIFSQFYESVSKDEQNLKLMWRDFPFF